MGLRDKLQSKLAKAFSGKLSDAVSPLTIFREQKAGEYDPDAGGFPSTTLEYQSRGVITSYHMKEIDGQRILFNDLKCIILQNEIEVIPVVGDVVNHCRVINVSRDPAAATYIIQMRLD